MYQRYSAASATANVHDVWTQTTADTQVHYRSFNVSTASNTVPDGFQPGDTHNVQLEFWAYGQTEPVYVHVSRHDFIPDPEPVLRPEDLMERWGVEELPDLDLEEVRAASEGFLESVLSPQELKMYREEGLIKVGSGLDPDVHYIVKKAAGAMIERYVKGELVERLCYVCLWMEIPELDVVASKILDLKAAEEQVLEVANSFPVQ